MKNRHSIYLARPLIMGEGETITADQVTAAMASPEIQKAVVDHMSSEKGGNFFVMSKEDQANAIGVIEGKNTDYKLPGFLGTVREQVKEYDIKPEIKGVHEKYDQDLKAFGVTRKQDQSTYEAYKEFATGLNNKIAELNETIKSGSGDDALKRQNEELQNKINGFEEEASAKIKAAEEKYKQIETEYNQYKSGSTVDVIYNKLSSKFKSPEKLGSFFESHKKEVISQAKENHVEEDGKLYMKKPDGTIMKKSNYEKMTVEEWLGDQFKDAIDTQRKVSGTGSGNNDDKKLDVDPSTINKDNFNPGDAKTQSELYAEMVAQGIKPGSKQFTEMWSALKSNFKEGA